LKATEQVFTPELQPDSRILKVTGEEHHHLARVRRFHVGDRVWALNGLGLAAETELVAITRDQAELRILNFHPERGEPSRSIVLALSTLKGDHFNDAAEKCTELGMTGIIPLNCTHSVKQGVAAERLDRILLTATKQCGRSRIPKRFERSMATDELSKPFAGKTLFCHAAAESIPIQHALGDGDPEDVRIFVGPEGGWAESEIDLAHQSGYTFAGLGSRRLRAETAAILAVGFVSSLQAFEPSTGTDQS